MEANAPMIGLEFGTFQPIPSEIPALDAPTNAIDLALEALISKAIDDVTDERIESQRLSEL